MSGCGKTSKYQGRLRRGRRACARGRTSCIYTTSSQPRWAGSLNVPGRPATPALGLRRSPDRAFYRCTKYYQRSNGVGADYCGGANNPVASTSPISTSRRTARARLAGSAAPPAVKSSRCRACWYQRVIGGGCADQRRGSAPTSPVTSGFLLPSDSVICRRRFETAAGCSPPDW